MLNPEDHSFNIACKEVQTYVQKQQAMISGQTHEQLKVSLNVFFNEAITKTFSEYYRHKTINLCQQYFAAICTYIISFIAYALFDNDHLKPNNVVSEIIEQISSITSIEDYEAKNAVLSDKRHQALVQESQTTEETVISSQSSTASFTDDYTISSIASSDDNNSSNDFTLLSTANVAALDALSSNDIDSEALLAATRSDQETNATFKGFFLHAVVLEKRIKIETRREINNQKLRLNKQIKDYAKKTGNAAKSIKAVISFTKGFSGSENKIHANHVNLMTRIKNKLKLVEAPTKTCLFFPKRKTRAQTTSGLTAILFILESNVLTDDCKDLLIQTIAKERLVLENQNIFHSSKFDHLYLSISNNDYSQINQNNDSSTSSCI